MQNLGFDCKLYLFVITKSCLVLFSKSTFLWITDDPLGQGDFLDYTNISYVIFSHFLN